MQNENIGEEMYCTINNWSKIFLWKCHMLSKNECILYHFSVKSNIENLTGCKCHKTSFTCICKEQIPFLPTSFYLFHNKLCLKVAADKNSLKAGWRFYFSGCEHIKQFVEELNSLVNYQIRKITKVCKFVPKAETVQKCNGQLSVCV